ncbi:TRAP transporter substrate-binding protein [Parahaliea aestuarii]|uniref:TRAP transporter substrate-binding protein n=1 Tax=Parahaliea aestuarii TaxID=1852021 RepID=A0A5C8ZTA2_9GAMM|nr:TRAP transporter substrate-binding protein [Parahaliea aestuarii]TXS91733.1 TRAP transporter substrate-binding protein [Parahaliea aestuarii]
MWQFIRALLSAALLNFLSACGVRDDVVVLHMAHTLDTGHTVHKAMLRLGERLEHYSGGSMRVALYPGGQLGNERELIELLQIGSLAMTKVSASPLEGFVPEMQVFNIPYVFRDKDHYQQVLDSQLGQQLLDAPLPVRLKGLGYYDAGSRSFYTVNRPVREPADLNGLKIRVQESQTALRMVGALGGAATPIAWGELYTALQQGVVDGAENNPPSFYLSGHYEICKYYTLDEHTAVPDLLLIGTVAWNALNAQQQQWLQRAVDDSVAYQRQLWAADSDAALAAVEAAGVEIIRPDKRKFQQQVAAMQAGYAGTAVGELIAQIAQVGR